MLKVVTERALKDKTLMRYLVVKKGNASPEVIVWTRSQYPVEVSLGITRECTHHDYMKRHNISLSDISSVGTVCCNVQTQRAEVSVLPWDIPAPKGDRLRVAKAAVAFVKKHPELLSDVQYEWNEYLWLKRQEKLAGRK